MHVSVCVNQVQLLVENQIEHCTATSADIITATTSILLKGDKRKSISRTKTIKISKNSPKVSLSLKGINIDTNTNKMTQTSLLHRKAR